MRRGFWLGLALFFVAAAVGAARQGAPGDLVVHEWGTFLAMAGSDGISLDGMYHEEHALPGFVHARSRDQLRIPSAFIKGETPVIYFYTPQRQSVSVHVAFPRGIWTQWYPQAQTVGPHSVAAGSPPQLRNGHISWNAEIIPAGTEAPPLPGTARDALWNYARQVDAAFVKTEDRTGPSPRAEYDRFLFYRGLGQAALPVRVSSAAGGTVSAVDKARPGARHLFVLRVENGKGAYRYLPSLAPGQRVEGVIPSMEGAPSLAEFTRKIGDDLAGRLVESGLYPKEARAMVNTWRRSYFETDGIRVLFALPQEWTDRFIPLTIAPQPKQVVRVMVGRVELLTPEREKRAEAAVQELFAPDAATRERGYAYLRDQGRYVEPILRRVMATTKWVRVETLCRRLLLADFVTELRSAVSDPNTGARVSDPPVYLRAQLASLLREVGLNDEAKAEAQRALTELERMPKPNLESSTARHPLRAYARAMEGMGDDAGAASAYGRFVDWGSKVRKCGGCHDTEGPRDMAWFRDWWGGRKYAAYVARAGRADTELAVREASLRRSPGDDAARLALAYLYEARGEKAKAGEMWAGLGVKEDRRRVAAGMATAR